MVHRLVVIEDERLNLGILLGEPIGRHVVDPTTVQEDERPGWGERLDVLDALLHLTEPGDWEYSKLEVFFV